jgi:hypothetical protein
MLRRISERLVLTVLSEKQELAAMVVDSGLFIPQAQATFPTISTRPARAAVRVVGAVAVGQRAQLATPAVLQLLSRRIRAKLA